MALYFDMTRSNPTSKGQISP